MDTYVLEIHSTSIQFYAIGIAVLGEMFLHFTKEVICGVIKSFTNIRSKFTGKVDETTPWPTNLMSKFLIAFSSKYSIPVNVDPSYDQKLLLLFLSLVHFDL